MSVLQDLKKLSNKKHAVILQRFFKTGPGEYGEGDIFWGIKVPYCRKVVAKYKDLPWTSLIKLIKHKVHEVRLTALLILVQKSKTEPKKAYDVYLKHTRYVNNWDLVDLTAGYIVGMYLFDKDKKILFKLAKSKSLWERRISIIATLYFITQGQSKTTLSIAKMLLKDKHDLIHKAVGWMLREVGKRCSQAEEEKFLDKYAKVMPRTMLRYAIERFPEKRRQYYLKLKTNS